MDHDAYPDLKLALKLIETFSDRRLRGFERYWALVGPVETFSRHAEGLLETRVAKAMQEALEEALARHAARSVHPDALAMVARLGLPRRRK